jgi:formylglycine-generating enzyme required for sulfatase activity
MVYIPPGKFIMGSAEDIKNDKSFDFGFAKPWIADASPHREAYLEGYYIDKYEASNADYEKFVTAAGHKPPEHWEKGKPSQKIINHPVTNISWYDALEYCKWKGKRLPTEEEWEKAARGTDGRLYPWGNEFDFDKANVSTSQSFETDTKDVKSYGNGKSPYGALNMTGNVWEWTLDWYKPYPGSKYESEFFGERFKVFRGNGYSGLAHLPENEYKRIIKEFSKGTFRFYSDPSGNFHDVGFRCVKEL